MKHDFLGNLIEKLRYPSLRESLLFLGVLVSLPAFALLISNDLHVRNLVMANAQRDVARLSDLSAAAYQDLIQDTVELLEFLSFLPIPEDPSQCPEMLSEIVAAHPQYDNLGIILTSGDVLCSAQPLEGPVNLADREWLIETLNTHEISIGEYQIGRVTGNLNFIVAYPKLDPAGQVKVVFTGAISLTWLKDNFEKDVLPVDSSQVLFDENGTVLAQSREHQWSVGIDVSSTKIFRNMTGRDRGVFESPGLDGIDRVYGFQKISVPEGRADLYTVVGIPISIIYAEIDTLTRIHLASMVITIALILIIVFLGSKHWLLAPMNKIVETTRRLAKKDFAARIGPLGGENEFNHIGRNIDVMAAELESSFRQLSRMNKALSLILECNRRITRSRDENLLLQSMCQAIIEIGSYPMVWIALLDEADELSIRFVATRDAIDAQGLENSSFAENPDNPCWQAVNSHKSMLIWDIQLNSISVPVDTFALRAGLKSAFAIPIKVNNQKFGIMVVFTDQEYGLDESELAMLTELGNDIAFGVSAIKGEAVMRSIHDLLKESEERYRTVFDDAPDGIFVVDGQFNLKDANERGCQILDYTREEITHLNLTDLLSQEDQRDIPISFESLRRGELLVANGRAIKKDGTEIPVEISARMLTSGYMLAIVRDIGERLEAEERLRQSEARFRLMFDNNPASMWAYNLETLQIIEVNEAAIQNYGYSSEEFLSMTILDLSSREDQERIRGVIRDISGIIRRPGVYRQYRKDGSYLDVEIITHDIILGGIPARLVIALDVTEKLRLEAEYKKQSEFIQIVMDNAPIMANLFDEDLHFLWVNKEWERILGWSLAEAMSEDVLARQFPDQEQRRRAIESILGTEGEWYQYTLKRKDGTELETIWSNVRLKDGRIVGIGSDISALRNMQKELITSYEQLRALALRLAQVEEIERKRLAQELHDRVGQNLTALSINLNLIQGLMPVRTRKKASPWIKDTQDLVTDTGEVIREVMMDLRPSLLDEYGLMPSISWYAEGFSKRTGVPVNVIGKDNQALLPSSISISLFRIVQEALNNVARHARATQVEIILEEMAERIVLIVKDDGVGFAPGAESSKSSDGKGWGLDIMRERAIAIGGTLLLQSEPGKGTILTVELRKPETSPALESKDRLSEVPE